MGNRQEREILPDTRWVWWLPKCARCEKKIDSIHSYSVDNGGTWEWRYECHGEVAKVRVSKKIYDYALKIAVTKVFLSLFLLLLLTPSLSYSQGLTIVNVGGYLAVTDEEVTDIYKQAGYYFKELEEYCHHRYFKGKAVEISAEELLDQARKICGKDEHE